MPRSKRIISDFNPYHITCRTNNRQVFPIPLKEVWDIFSDHFFLIDRGFNIKIHGFVLMPNHYHLLASSPERNLSQAMAYLNRNVSLCINYESGRINHCWGKRFYSTEISSSVHYLNVLKYLYRNPVKAKLSEGVEGYSYSSYHYLFGSSQSVYRIREPMPFFLTRQTEISDIPQWLNTNYDPKLNEIIALQLRKPKFEIKNTEDCPYKKILETELI